MCHSASATGRLTSSEMPHFLGRNVLCCTSPSPGNYHRTHNVVHFMLHFADRQSTNKEVVTVDLA